jgi:hypothetical protein
VEPLPHGFVTVAKDVCDISASNFDRFIPEERNLQNPIHMWLGCKLGIVWIRCRKKF